MVIFGGADSGATKESPTHFQDVIIYKKAEEGKVSAFKSVAVTGDVPMARSGHSVVAYGKYMLLFGGVVFSHKPEENCAYNDLYLFSTGAPLLKLFRYFSSYHFSSFAETYMWHYVGEAGVEVTARGSHSMGIVYNHNITTNCSLHETSNSNTKGSTEGGNDNASSVINNPVSGGKNYLVIYGGSSPEHGPLNDTVYAELPDLDSIGIGK